MPLHALIFDVDGTLAETEELHLACFNQAFAGMGLPWIWSREIYAELLEITGGKERIAHFIATHDARPALDRRAVALLHEAKTAIYARSVLGGAAPLRPGVRRLLAEARQHGLALAIATTTSRDSVNALLLASFGADALQQFAYVAASDSVSAKKPAPDVYKLVLTQLGIGAGDAIAVEDTRNGLRAARAAGIEVVVTRSAFGGEGGLDDALVVVDHLGDPGNPCRVLQGHSMATDMITIAELKRMQGF